MTINFIMNSVNDAHAIKRINDFEEQGFKVRLFGFDRNIDSKKRRNDITIIGSFKNNTRYYKRISTYIKGIKRAFKYVVAEESQDCLWFYQGLDTALFAYLLGKRHKYIYEECDLVHTNIGNSLIRSIFEKIDKHIIKNSYKTIMTSEGFLKFHYKNSSKAPKNIIILPNKLPTKVEIYMKTKHGTFNAEHIKFAFIGGLRYKSLIMLAKHIAHNFPNHEFHFYGYVSPTIRQEDLPNGDNIFYHGSFSSPKDLPEIYAETDVVVATYDISSPNVRYAEPNKLYEAMYFRCPIVVSKNTFLEEKVKKMKIGYSVDAYNENDVIGLVKDIECHYFETKETLSKIDKITTLDNYKIKEMLLN